MSKVNKQALLIGSVAAFAFTYLYNTENRSKAKVAFKNTKAKMDSYMDSRKNSPTYVTKTGYSDPGDPDDNRMIEEGAMTSIRYFNENAQDKVGNNYPKSYNKQTPVTEESLEDSNDKSPAKQQNTKRMNPE